MQEQDGLNPAERELELALHSLQPAAVQIDPAAAAFAAGRRSARRQVRLWQSAAAAMLLVSAGMPLAQLGGTGGSTVAEHRRAAGSKHEVQPLSDQSLAMLRAAVRERGVDGLPGVQLQPASTVRAHDTF